MILAANDLPVLPLLLWGTPPGLEQILMQEGVPFRRIDDPHPMAFRGGRFVLYDGRVVRSKHVRQTLDSGHVALDIDVLRREATGGDPFERLIDTTAARASWTVDGVTLSERVSRQARASIRKRLIGRIRAVVARAGGVWARLSPYPHPYRSAFHFRADLDEPYPDDVRRFLAALEPIEDAATLFVSMRAYGDDVDLLNAMRGLDVQSHGYDHVVHRRDRLNRDNVFRADAILRERGFRPVGFAAPEGRWTPGLDRAIEDLGYEYSSDFAIGFDDYPFYPIRDGQVSRVLQVPIHPVCEGLFLDAGMSDPIGIARYLVETVRRKVEAGEPAFVYGHPERRLGRFPEVVTAVARAALELDRTWKVTLTEFARWWRWRSQRTWSLVPKGEGRYSVQFDEWDTRYPLGLEIVRGEHSASFALLGSSQMIRPGDLAFVRKTKRADPPHPRIVRPAFGLKSALRAALDWETVTPTDDLPEATMRDRIKKRLRRWREPGVGRRA